MTNRQFLSSCLFSSFLLAGSAVVNFYADNYANESASRSVTDIVLSNIRVYDVDSIFVYGTFLLAFGIVVVCLLRPEKIPFTLKSIALFVIIRSIFISLTHIGADPARIPLDSISFANHYVQGIFTGDDLFFSGHTGLPLLIALIFWDVPIERMLFLATSIIFAVVVLLGHLHYSIDVLAAFFITYSIYCLAKFMFIKDLRWLTV